MEMSRLTREVTAEPVSRDQIFRRECGLENLSFPCSADHEQDWQPHPVDPYSCCMCDHEYILHDIYVVYRGAGDGQGYAPTSSKINIPITGECARLVCSSHYYTTNRCSSITINHTSITQQNSPWLPVPVLGLLDREKSEEYVNKAATRA